MPILVLITNRAFLAEVGGAVCLLRSVLFSERRLGGCFFLIASVCHPSALCLDGQRCSGSFRGTLYFLSRMELALGRLGPQRRPGSWAASYLLQYLVSLKPQLGGEARDQRGRHVSALLQCLV